jgi:hypothetical protein
MVFEPLFTTRTEWSNRVANVALVGELDMAGVPIFEADLAPVRETASLPSCSISASSRFSMDRPCMPSSP